MQSSKHSIRKSTARAWTIACAFMLALASLSCTSAWGQSSQLLLQPLANKNTPREVASGVAKLVQPYEPSSKLRLAISIKAPKMSEEEQFLKELQDKKSPNFHKYLTPEQWNARFAPAAADEQAVVDWASSRELTVINRYPNRLIVNVEGTVDAIQRAFNIHINRYEVNGSVEFSNDRDPQIPSKLEGIVQYVDGLNSILRMRPANSKLKGVRSPDYTPGAFLQNGPSVRTEASKTSAPAKSAQKTGLDGSQITNGYLDPSDIFSSNLYDYNALMAQGHCCNPTGNSGGTPPQTTIALATDGDFANSDVLEFASIYGLQFQGYRIFVGGTPGGGDDETTLDFEWSSTTANSFYTPQASSTIRVYEAAKGFGDFGSVFNQMVTDNDMRIVNISYGLNESYLNGLGLVSSWHSIFNQMLGQGMTIMAAAGDGGATAGCGDSIAVLYPGSDPDVVSVGGTQVELYSDGSFYSEAAWTGGTAAGSCNRNDGGTGGGCSVLFAAPGYQASPACGSGSRSVPDIALNAGTGQNYYFDGSLSGVGGTSISSPMMSGFIAQSNAYLAAIGLGPSSLGEVNYDIYYQGYNAGGEYASPHYPFYDITSGCNSNDITAEYGLGSYCAGTGYDLTTGWGSFNALQLSWAINSYWLGAFEAPTVTFSGPSHTQGADNWYNTDQTVSWTVTSNASSGLNPTGVAGFSQAWDAYIDDPYSEATPGSGNAFYSGPQFPNATSGYLDLASAGQGCHYATVDAWDNAGYTSSNQFYFYLCYDTIAPTVTASNSPGPNSYGYNKTSVNVTLSASDPGGSTASGIKTTYYALNNTCSPSTLGACSVYSGPVSITSTGFTYMSFFTKDVAGNNSAVSYDYLYIDVVAPVTSESLSGTLVGSVYESAVKVTLSATDNYSGVLSTTYTLDGGAATTYSSPITVSTPGSHHVTYYSVDRAGNTETTKSLSFTIDSPTTTSISSSTNPSIYGQGVTLTAKVTPALGAVPTGTVTFKYGTVVINTGTLNGSGVASIVTGGFAIGTHAVVAVYNGSSTDLASTSPVLNQVVEETTTTTLTSSLNPSTYGKSVTFTATVKPTTSGSPTGSVQFLNGTTLLSTVTTSSSGVATYTTSTLPGGSDSITAVYVGNSNYETSTSAALKETVALAATSSSVTTSVNPSTFGQSVTITATVTSSGGSPSGNMSIKNNGVTFGSATVTNGKATFTTTTLPVGSNSITVLYDGNADFNYSTSPAVVQKVIAASTATTVSSSLNPSTFGESVTLTATVTSSGGTPTGNVSFKKNGATFGSVALVGGKATITTTTLAVGADSITALYDGNTDFNYSTSPAVLQTVQSPTATTISSSLNPSTVGAPVTLTAKVTATSGPTPTGTVTFKFGTTTIATSTLNSSGVASTTFSGFKAGTHSVDAVYNGSTTDLTSTSPVLSQVVNN